MDLIDLHTHSNYSDGILSPTELIDLAKHSGLKAISLTDHDTMAGIDEASGRGSEQNIEVVPGVEISAVHEGQSVHVLAYNPGPSPELQQLLSGLQQARLLRNRMIMANLNRLSISATLEDLARYSPVGQTGRPHIARLLKDMGVVKTVEQAFNRYLKKGGLAYEESTKFPVTEVTRTINNAGGLAVLAHPGHIEPRLTALPKLLRLLTPLGLAGLEVYHPSHSAQMIRELQKMATDHGLLQTGGSDFHGDGRTGPLGPAGGLPRISYELLTAMKHHANWSSKRLIDEYHSGR
jgi:3',5'-nucleoside bisphosphate phosphatase